MAAGSGDPRRARRVAQQNRRRPSVVSVERSGDRSTTWQATRAERGGWPARCPYHLQPFSNCSIRVTRCVPPQVAKGEIWPSGVAPQRKMLKHLDLRSRPRWPKSIGHLGLAIWVRRLLIHSFSTCKAVSLRQAFPVGASERKPSVGPVKRLADHSATEETRTTPEGVDSRCRCGLTYAIIHTVVDCTTVISGGGDEPASHRQLPSQFWRNWRP